MFIEDPEVSDYFIQSENSPTTPFFLATVLGRAIAWSFVGHVAGRSVGLLVCIILSFFLQSALVALFLGLLNFFLFQKGAEDDLRKVTDLAYKQVSYYLPHSGANYCRQKRFFIITFLNVRFAGGNIWHESSCW